MAYTATVIPVMIASPGDVLSERNIAREIINDWNSIYALATKTILTPVGWDSHTSPDLGGRPQKLINERVLKDCDLLVGIFWTRLGTPTGDSESGTVEEIQTHLAAGKPAMVYFSNAPVAPAALNPGQYEALKKFRAWCEHQGLISTFENGPEFQLKFARELQIQMNTHQYLKRLREDAEKSPWDQALSQMPTNLGRQTELSAEARELLLEAAADDDGYLMKVVHMSGAYIQTNGKSFGQENHRAFSKWERAIEQLQRANLIEARGHKGEVFQITADGYELAEKLNI